MRRIKLLNTSVSNLNVVVVVTVGLLCLAGFLALYSASLYITAPFFKKVVGKQLIWMILGAAGMISVVFLQRKTLFDVTYIGYWIGIVLIIAPYFIGVSDVMARRWLRLGPFQFQPSELMKIWIIFAIARYLSKAELVISDFRSLIVPLFLVIFPLVIVLRQPDLGTSIIYLMLAFPMLFWAGARVYHLFIICAPIISIITAFSFYSFFIWVVLLLVVLYFSKEKLWLAIVLFVFNLSLGFVTPVIWNNLKPYQQNRIMTLFHVDADPQGSGYQVIQSQTAIGSGGIFGKGIGHGTQTHLKFLPEQHNDFIFSVIGEEYGFAGVIFVICLFLILFFVLINQAYHQRDRFSSLIIIGVTSILFFHTAVNISMTIGLLPVTGLPLPFLSYGGSFVITCFLLIGLVLNFGSERPR